MIGPAVIEPAAADRASTRDRVVVLGLGTAAAYAALAQGGFYGRQAAVVLLLVAVAGAARAAVHGRPVPSAVGTAAACWVLFALWALASGQLAGDVAAALPTAALACCLAVAAVSAAGLPEASRRVLLGALLAVSAAVAASCWVGVALHLQPLALLSSGLWRAASTLTYANATAAFLAVSLVVAVAVGPRNRLAANGLVALLLLGLVLTMSRAGALALVVALAVYVALGRDEPLRRHAPVLPAVTVAAAGLLPSLPAGAPPHPLPAIAAAAAGGAVLVLAQHVRARHLVAAAAAAVALLLLALPAVPEALRGIGATRLTAASAERTDLARVTAEQFWSAPLTGVGPGRLDLRYVDHTGTRVRAGYTHDEYLQTAAETGVVGLALVLGGLAALAVAAVGSRTRDGAAAAAVIAGFAVHSAFDFLWHIPVLPLLLVLSAVSLTPHVPIKRSRCEHEAEDHRRGRHGAGDRRGTRMARWRGERAALGRAAEPGGG